MHKILRCVLIGVAAGLTVTAQSAAPVVVRGPYLQLTTPKSTVIRWRTDQPAANTLRFGINDSLTKTASTAGEATEHVVLLDKLLPDTSYSYRLTNGTNSIAETNLFRFRTSPVVGTEKPVRIWALGDAGTYSKEQKAVRDAFTAYSKAKSADFIILLGDNAYPNGRDREYQAGLFQMYRDYLNHTPLWPAFGNHDGRNASSPTQSGVYYDIFTLPTMAQAGGVMSGTEAYYSYDYANIHMICLDSHDTDRGADQAMAQWLRADLAFNKQPWKIAYWHHPPYSKGSHDSDNAKDSGARMNEMRETFNPILEAASVDLVLCGHSHVYERSFFLNGHYRESKTFDPMIHVKQPGFGGTEKGGAYVKPSFTPNSGTVYVVSGSAGHAEGGKLNHPAMAVSLNEPGSFIVDVEAGILRGTFLNGAGKVRDQFEIRHSP